MSVQSATALLQESQHLRCALDAARISEASLRADKAAAKREHEKWARSAQAADVRQRCEHMMLTDEVCKLRTALTLLQADSAQAEQAARDTAEERDREQRLGRLAAERAACAAQGAAEEAWATVHRREAELVQAQRACTETEARLQMSQTNEQKLLTRIAVRERELSDALLIGECWRSCLRHMTPVCSSPRPLALDVLSHSAQLAA